MYEPVRISGPTIPPISLADIKEHIRVDDTNDDNWLDAATAAARDYVEWRTGRTLMETTWEFVRDHFPPAGWALVLPNAAPLLSVTFIKYTDSNNVVNTWAASNYLVNTDHRPGFVTPIYGGTWPDYTPAPTGSVRVRYVAGLSNSASPLVYPDESLLWPIRLLVGAFNENREAEVFTNMASIQAVSIKYGVEAFIARQKVNHAF